MTLPVVLGVVVLSVAGSAALHAQDICVPAKDSHEANTFAALSVPVAFTSAGAPGVSRGVWLGLEIASLPTVSRADATPTACRPGKGPENTNPIPVLIRPRIALAFRGFVFEASWIPPVRVATVRANLIGLAITHPHPLGHGWVLGLRAEAVLGSLRAPITCDDAALRDVSSDCFGGTRSDDRWQPGVFGAEAVIGGGRGRIRPHLGIGYNWLRPRFEVNFTNAADSTDHRRIQVNLQRVAVFAGVTTRIGWGSVTAEAYSTPADAVTARLVFRTLLGR
ncbi:MAG: hypothetical protein ACRELE_03870 [Gemmatimonadales bacterium]